MAYVTLVGAEYEENLSLRYLAAAARAGGFSAAIVPYDGPDETERVMDAILATEPEVVGISVPFQHRAPELLGLAATLRARGYAGHVVVGGHFATFEYAAILDQHPAIDSVARHEGEDTLVELCGRVRDGRSLAGTAGLIVRAERRGTLPIAGQRGAIVVGEKRPLPHLDALPLPDRSGAPHDVLGVLCSPIVGSRGCYADCSFCCIFAYADNADGARYRMRSPEEIAREMKQEYELRGVRLFVFHDDNFFVPHAPKNLKRYRRLGELLRAEGMTDIALVIKCRPNDVDRELFEVLREMGAIRAYVGIETNSGEGIVSLNRRITSEDNRRALRLLRELGFYCSFNVLMFDPEATLAGVEANLAFMEEFADVPFNFCRAEVYAGTPLKATLEKEGRLRGDYLAWTYEMKDPRVELLFRVCTTAFYGRNFKPDGIANLNMGIRFDAEVLKRFHPDGWDDDYGARLEAFSRGVGTDTVKHVREALAFAREVALDDRAAVHGFTLALARKVSQSDLELLGRVKALRREMEERAGRSNRLTSNVLPARPWAAETARLGTSVGREISTEVLPAPARRLG